jgi:hypothetical protein
LVALVVLEMGMVVLEAEGTLGDLVVLVDLMDLVHG